MKLKYAITIALLTLSANAAAASLVGQTEPDENGRVICYYEDFNTGAQYMKHELYVCPSS